MSLSSTVALISAFIFIFIFLFVLNCIFICIYIHIYILPPNIIKMHQPYKPYSISYSIRFILKLLLQEITASACRVKSLLNLCLFSWHLHLYQHLYSHLFSYLYSHLYSHLYSFTKYNQHASDIITILLWQGDSRSRMKTTACSTFQNMEPIFGYISVRFSWGTKIRKVLRAVYTNGHKRNSNDQLGSRSVFQIYSKMPSVTAPFPPSISLLLV